MFKVFFTHKFDKDANIVFLILLEQSLEKKYLLTKLLNFLPLDDVRSTSNTQQWDFPNKQEIVMAHNFKGGIFIHPKILKIAQRGGHLTHGSFLLHKHILVTSENKRHLQPLFFFSFSFPR